MSTLGDALKFAGRPERISHPSDERFVTVRMNGGGAVERRIGSGKTPVPFTGYRVRAGQFIYSRIDARNGAYALVPSELDGAVVSKDFPVFDVRTDRALPEYLLHFMRAGSLQRQVQAASFGATNRQRVSEETFLGFSLQLPSIDEQRRIAAILDYADALRAKRRQANEGLSQLQAAMFTSMFATAPRRPLSELATTTSGGTPRRDVEGNYGGTIPWVKSGELHSGVITSTEETLTQQGLASSSAKLLPPGTVLLAMYGATAGVVGELGIEATTNQAVCAITPGEELDAAFLVGALRSQTATLVSRAAGGAQPNLSQGIVRELPIPFASIRDQRAYAQRVASIRAERARATSHSLHLDELFASLQARAFRGEL
ncbi:restriction endonuclease subunit S [Schumannella soli]|uniref:Restriction endonuclease subunit S n=1 Tax=Schumannella soli TaxID=2590779 RepID=A0A506Y6P3_9MICO|nr:restriction endonuclease subunit S [Schumannella soli]TPW77712.1 restriction endonuclease subunit S [Schumannella soli]